MNLKIEKITIYGSKKDVEFAQKTLLQSLPMELFKENESIARLKIQSLIDEFNFKVAITWNGNTVWSKKKILKDLKRIMHKGMDALTDHLYGFFNLCCGSIAHYNKQGWICEYPNLEALRNFFYKNEYGHGVLEWQPWWTTDRIEIIKEVYKMFGLKETP